jgi:endonuclease/exonuclease/phosphatase family metal-dependent hydrolase
MPDLNIAWWNLENLFDRETAARPPELAQKLANELRGWTTAVRNRKLAQLASVVESMFGGAGPDILGVCEVENERVLNLLVNRINLPGRNYDVVAHNSPDARGIDVSFIVDLNTLQVVATDHQVVVKRSATRDIFWVELTEPTTGATFVAIANHWPARSAGQYESEPFRMLTGETLSFVLSDLFTQSNLGNDLPVILMGDFNDEPFNRSMREYLLGTRDDGSVRRSRSAPRVFNLMWPLMDARNLGTYRYGSEWNMLDQFLVTKGMLRNNSAARVRRDTVEIFRSANILGTGGRPRRFGRPSKNSLDNGGFSDHFPITIILRTHV